MSIFSNLEYNFLEHTTGNLCTKTSQFIFTANKNAFNFQAVKLIQWQLWMLKWFDCNFLSVPLPFHAGSHSRDHTSPTQFSLFSPSSPNHMSTDLTFPHLMGSFLLSEF